MRPSWPLSWPGRAPPPPPPPPPPAHDPWSLHGLLDNIFLDPNEVDELQENLSIWFEASFVCLMLFAAVHVGVRIVSHLGYGHDKSKSLLQRFLWATLYAIFPQAKPVRWAQPASVVVGKAADAFKRRYSATAPTPGISMDHKLAASAPQLTRCVCPAPGWPPPSLPPHCVLLLRLTAERGEPLSPAEQSAPPQHATASPACAAGRSRGRASPQARWRRSARTC